VAVTEYTDIKFLVFFSPARQIQGQILYVRSFLHCHFQFRIHGYSYLILNKLNIEIFINNPHTNQ